jgi:hypothetical protein
MTLTSTTFFDRPAYQLGNDLLSVTIVPSLSARVMALMHDEHNYFWNNEPLLRGEPQTDNSFGKWLNWGGYKTWLAPQSRWPSPAEQSPAMDNANWEVVAQAENEIDLIGPMIPWAGVRLGRHMTVAPGEARVQVTEYIRNDGDTPQSWGVWSVLQFPVPGWATYPPDGERKTIVPPVQIFEGDRVRFKGDAKWKIGAFTSGWGSYQADGWAHTFKANFAAHPQLPHPDLCTLETWSNSGPAYMELEWLGPTLNLHPGERWDFETEWVIE